MNNFGSLPEKKSRGGRFENRPDRTFIMKSLRLPAGTEAFPTKLFILYGLVHYLVTFLKHWREARSAKDRH
jgi:hypothetical protein